MLKALLKNWCRRRLPQSGPTLSMAPNAETEEEEDLLYKNDVIKSGDEEEDENDDEEEENVVAKKPNVPNPQSKSASDEDDDGNCETPSTSDFIVKPTAPAKKRAAAETDSNPRDSKKKRAATKKGGQGRLSAMIEFQKRGTDPSSNMEANRLDDVETKLRKSAEADSKRQTVLALRASDWAEKKAVRNNVKKKKSYVRNNVENKVEEVNVTNVEFWANFPNLRESLRIGSCLSNWEGLERVLSQKLPSIGSSKAQELDDKWRKLQVFKNELAVKKLDLIHEQTKLALEVMNLRKD